MLLPLWEVEAEGKYVKSRSRGFCKEKVWKNLGKVGGVHIALVGSAMCRWFWSCKEISAPESLKVQLTKLLTANNVPHYNVPLATKIYPYHSKFWRCGKSWPPSVLRGWGESDWSQKGTLSFRHLGGDLGRWRPQCSAQSGPGRIRSKVNQGSVRSFQQRL